MKSIERSTAALTSLNEKYSTLDTLLASSKSLISTLVSSQKSDTWYLETALWILVYTIGWLVFRRWFYGPVRYLLYIPTKWTLNLFLSVIQVALGIFTGTSRVEPPINSPSTTLVVQPSATGRAPTRNPGMAAPSVRVGAGGSGAKREHDVDEDLSEKYGRMAEESREQERQHQAGNDEHQKREVEVEEEVAAEEEDGETKGNDERNHRGTVLRERRPDERPNPHKRMWEERIPRGDEDDYEEEEEEEERGTVLRERRPNERPNPKKRMWEEPIYDREHDEL